MLRSLGMVSNTKARIVAEKFCGQMQTTWLARKVSLQKWREEKGLIENSLSHRYEEL